MSGLPFRGPSRAAPDPGGARRRLVRASAPRTVFAVGDIHGCLDLLRALEARIAARLAADPARGPALIVVLGDAIDRGPHSAGVVAHLTGPAPPGTRRLWLCGNHEAMAAAFLAAPRPGHPWLAMGGRETLRSYGLDPDAFPHRRALRRALRDAIPESHRAALASLPLSLETPRHFFVHAGIDPDRPLSGQAARDSLWGRRSFLSHRGPLPKCVVHGHTPTAAAVITPGRIGVDTGAYITGLLTSVQLTEGRAPRALAVSASRFAAGAPPAGPS